MFYIAQYPVRWPAQSVSYVSTPDRPVHSNTNSASPGSILAMQQLRATTIHSHVCMYPGTQLNIYIMYMPLYSIFTRTLKKSVMPDIHID